MPQTEVIILGAGVIGLSIAHVLATRDPIGSYNIKVVARDLPSDDLSSPAFASPWAGANWSPMGDFDEHTYKRETITFNKLWDLIPTGLVKKLPSRVFYAENTALDQLWYKDLVRDFRVMSPDELVEGVAGGVRFTTVSVNPEIYLPWLQAELRARGVQFTRRTIHSLAEAAALAGPNGVLVNATALGARSLIGVEDTDVFPIRGQTILVHAPSIQEFITIIPGSTSSNGEGTYMIPRPSPEGHVLLGGTFQAGNWDTSFDVPTAHGILERCAVLAPSLLTEQTRILKHGVGLRPARNGGPRIEAGWWQLPLKSSLISQEAEQEGKLLIVHAYGFGPAGYQNSWGAAEEVITLIENHLKL